MSIERVKCVYCDEIVAEVDTDELQMPLSGDMLTPLHPEYAGHPLFSQDSNWETFYCICNATLDELSHRILYNDGELLLEDGAYWIDGEGVVGRHEPADLWEEDEDMAREWEKRSLKLRSKPISEETEQQPQAAAPKQKRRAGKRK
ncbi:hypothetical protein [Oceanidesulfovibrio marinus]|uniref:Uncharacterized protein n=1 Tax=Oceanidesulfovibrio marinus TaxID=370038 RepID=A0A6P1ZFI7_9BACT|nr:hypothetical protein [Oceanidesulfovibrio marinus]TVM31170.1 hypothetical protein DQK91_18850 [Oceanidesulfovibrio marinus]